MYISEITIEGFKSYAQRVTLSNFDQAFNAITGLNGTGKSNVLDSICFVLGIKNLNKVRAGNLQELVYKHGQAGITKATVSITWHNNDPASSPAGYEDKERITITRTVVVGGRNKYTINGVAAQENRVHDFFHSVQLNVNNPHFLIMQGFITKVLNMKPPEILSMLEEAAGTRMYEKKREAALRTLDKKQARLHQIDELLNDEILPSLKTLQTKAEQYREWERLESSRARLRNLIVAFDYMTCAKQVSDCQGEMSALREALEGNARKQQDVQGVMCDEEGVIQSLQTEKEIQSGGEIKELQAAVDKLSMDLTTGTTHWKSRCNALEGERAGLASLQAQAEQLAAQDLPAQLASAEASRDAATQALADAQAAVEAAQCELAGAEAGDGRDHTNKTLKERLSDTQREVTQAEAEQKAAQVKAKLLADQLAASKKALAACGKEAAQAQASRQQQQAVVADCQAKLAGLGYDAGRAAALEASRAAAAGEVRRLKDEVDRLSQDVQGCSFRYSNPGGSFDPSHVHGVLAQLVHVQHASDTLALEVTAGGKLYQVVVDDDTTAKQLLEKGRLTRRVTIIPLNKVQYPTLSNSVLAAAEKLGGGKAAPALQLVGYASEVEAAMKYAFGNCFVCQDAGTAKKLAFSRDVWTRCVTLEGDDFNPAGLLTGGTRNVSKSLLSSLHALSEAEAALAAAKHTLAGLEAELQGTSAKAKQHSKLQQELELAQHSLMLLEERLAGTQAAQLASSAESLAAELEEAQAAAQAAGTRKAELTAACKAMEQEVASFSSGQQARIKAAQAKLKAAKAAVEKCKAVLKTCEAAVVSARAELEGAADEQEGLAAKIQEAQASCQALSKEAERLEGSVAAARAAYQDAEQQLNARRARLRECDADITGREKGLTKLRRSLQDLEVEARKMDNKLKAKQVEVKRIQDAIAGIEKDFPYVVRDKSQFGSGDYDFSKYDFTSLKKEYAEADVQCAQLKGKANSKDVDKLSRAESEYNALMVKRDTVEKDRLRITEVISELDDVKRVAMEQTWEKVNEYFGSIFSMLLPNTEARLEPPEGATFEEGLEVRVAFGGVWKTSLTELSGGQRSLLALSLILALCRFKPAPLYILDEVDSALDLNHTQNIGQMIRHHFPQSQFLVVSLKEGMFSNANVIFRTKFVDGVSNITRTVPSSQETALRGAAPPPAAAAKQMQQGAAGKGGAAGKPGRRPLAAMNS